MSGKKLLIVSACLIAFATSLVAGLVGASGKDRQDYLNWFKSNNSHLRTAISYLRTQNADFAALALEELIAAKPPAAIEKNKMQIVSLMTTTAKQALDQIDDDDFRAARRTLLGLRRKVFQAHQKIGVVVFADCIWQLRSTGLQMWYYRKRDNGPDLADEKQSAAVASSVTAYLDQLKTCNGRASNKIKSSGDYSRIFIGVRQTLEKVLTESIPNRNGRELYRRLNEIRSFDRLLFFRFG